MKLDFGIDMTRDTGHVLHKGGLLHLDTEQRSMRANGRHAKKEYYNRSGTSYQTSIKYPPAMVGGGTRRWLHSRCNAVI